MQSLASYSVHNLQAFYLISLCSDYLLSE